MIAGVDPDGDYLDFGYWVQTTEGPDGATSYEVDAFYRGEEAYGNVGALEGTASYTGRAGGLFTKRALSATGPGDLEAAGRFTADADLKAYFGGNLIGTDLQDSIGGTITNFQHDGNVIDPLWRVPLNTIGGVGGPGDFSEQDGTFTGGMTTSADDTWGGRFYGDDTPVGTDSVVPLPSSVAGEFTAGFNNGNVIGAFGATLVPATK